MSDVWSGKSSHRDKPLLDGKQSKEVQWSITATTTTTIVVIVY